MVAGVSSAKTNNSLGLAGVGFNSKFMPIKIFTSSDGFSANEYEAMIYAADKGCKVLNLSWGAAGAFCQFGQDVINYVALDKDVVIVAAAGNTPDNLDFYPASYENVLSVGATDNLDQKWSFATYSVHIDVTAPGQNVFTAKAGNTRDLKFSVSSILADKSFSSHLVCMIKTFAKGAKRLLKDPCQYNHTLRRPAAPSASTWSRYGSSIFR